MSKVKTQLVLEGKNNTQKAFNEVNGQLTEMNKRMAGVGDALKGALSIAAVTEVAKQYASMVDTTKQLEARLRLATSSQEEFNEASSQVRRIATENGQSIQAVTQLYTRLAPALKDAGRSQADIVKVTEAVSKALRISGASAAESEGAIIQFAQALGSGALRGDEFNSVNEAAPRLMRALADSLGVPVGALKEMATQGQLTADVVTDALISQLPTLAKEAEQFGPSFSGSIQQLEDATMAMVAALDHLTGASGRAIASMNGVAGALTGLAAGDKIGANLATIALELGKQIPLLGQAVVGAELVLARLGINAEKNSKKASQAGSLAASELASTEQGRISSARKYQLQLDMIEKAEVDRNVRRLANDEKAAAEQLGIKYDEVESLKQWAEEMGTTYEEFIEREAERHKLRSEAEKSGQKLVSDARRKGLADLKSSISAQEKTLKDANKKLDDARKQTLKIEEEFNKLVSDIRSSGDGAGAPTFAGAQDALLAAKQAKAAGDGATAIDQARRAGEILKELKSSGANTYGFEGMAEQIRQVAVEASKLKNADLEADVKSIESKMESLKVQAEALKVVSIDLQMDDTNVEQVKARMLAIAADLAKAMIIKPTIVAPDYDFTQPYTLKDPGPAPTGYATGGRVRGPGTGTSDSIMARLSNGEFVMRAAAVRAYGPALLEKMNGLRIPKFADGGLVGAAMSAPVGQSGRDLGRVDLNVNGETISLFAGQETFTDLVQRQKWKRGSTRKA